MPLAGASYYRIKTKDMSGQLSYSKIVMVKDCQTDNVYLSGNGNNATMLNLRLEQGASIEINLYDESGRGLQLLPLTGKKQFQTGYHQLPVNMAAIPKGIYLLSVSINGKTSMHRVVNQ